MIHTGLRAAYGYFVVYSGLLVFALGSLIWSCVAALLCHLLPKAWGVTIGRRVSCYGFRLYLWCLTLTGAATFELRALDALRDAGPLVIAPNHPCLLDAVMIVSRLPDVACVAKAKLIDSPVFGASARLAGYIRNDDFFGGAVQAVETLRAGSQLLLFPEGTRTTRPPIDRLKGGAALVADRVRVAFSVQGLAPSSHTVHADPVSSAPRKAFHSRGRPEGVPCRNGSLFRIRAELS
jgi:1-acyl-sn-glycerol-3-phosphate acyltransferase